MTTQRTKVRKKTTTTQRTKARKKTHKRNPTTNWRTKMKMNQRNNNYQTAAQECAAKLQECPCSMRIQDTTGRETKTTMDLRPHASQH